MKKNTGLYPWSIKDVIKEVNIKKRTLIFWVSEYGLENFMTHSNAGNTYSDKAVKFLKVIKLLKDRAWFSADFIKIIIERLKKDPSRNPLSELDILEDLGSRLCSLLNRPVTCPQTSDKDTELQKLENMIENFPDNPDYDDWVFTAAELCKEKLKNYEKARFFYKKLIESNSSYKEIAKIYLEILENF
jgi:DNA-binding transcriptional MerR regulator